MGSAWSGSLPFPSLSLTFVSQAHGFSVGFLASEGSLDLICKIGSILTDPVTYGLAPRELFVSSSLT